MTPLLTQKGRRERAGPRGRWTLQPRAKFPAQVLDTAFDQPSRLTACDDNWAAVLVPCVRACRPCESVE